MKLTQPEIDQMIEEAQSKRSEFTLRQLELLRMLDESGQLHLVDQEIKFKYLQELRSYELSRSGIQIKSFGGESE